MCRQGTAPEVRPGVRGAEGIKMRTVSGLMMRLFVKSVQVWRAKEGPKLAQLWSNDGAKGHRCNLLIDGISSAAWATYNLLVPPWGTRRWLHEGARVLAEQTSSRAIRRTFDDFASGQPEQLDVTERHPEPFGSYFKLIYLDRLRFREMYSRTNFTVARQPARR